MKYLSLWEFAKKQDYIFKSNKLIEAVGASLIIKKLTEDFSKYNLKDDNFIIKKGGKALYIFDTLKEAKEFNSKFSIEILKEYQGLEVFMVIKEFNEVDSDIRLEIEEIYELLEKKKSERRNACHQIAFGIERPCKSTSLPASTKDTVDNIESYYSKESKKKIEFGRNNQDESFNDLIPEGYKLEREVDKLVNENKKSYLAVIHIDGNAMGKKFKKLKNEVEKKKDESICEFNKRYTRILKSFSKEVDKSYKEAFKYTMSIIEKNKEKLMDVTNLKDGYFPVRPIILAGDDITFITNGYIGIESAKIFIDYLSKKRINIEGNDLGTLSACAGVAIIRKGYPFIKGYELAEELCANGKKFIVENEEESLNVLDFHIAQGEIVGDLNYIREKSYSLNGKSGLLTMRPLVINNEKYWRSYENFIKTYNNITNAIKNKNIGRNKIKALRSELIKGEEATEHFIKFYSIDAKKYLPLIHGRGDYCFNNQDEGRCMYLDAIEVMDMFIKFEE